MKEPIGVLLAPTITTLLVEKNLFAWWRLFICKTKLLIIDINKTRDLYYRLTLPRLMIND